MNQKQIRIKVLLGAYAYQMLDKPIMSDAEWDDLASQVVINESTSNSSLDKWFKQHFQPYTAQWIYTYPELDKLQKLYNRLFLGDSAKELL